MDKHRIRSITAWSAIAAAITILAAIPLYFVYDGPPSPSRI